MLLGRDFLEEDEIIVPKSQCLKIIEKLQDTIYECNPDFGCKRTELWKLIIELKSIIED